MREQMTGGSPESVDDAETEVEAQCACVQANWRRGEVRAYVRAVHVCTHKYVLYSNHKN